MILSPSQVKRWRNQLESRIPANAKINLDAVTSVTQAVNLLQTYGIYSEMRRLRATHEHCETVMRRIFPNLNSDRPRW